MVWQEEQILLDGHNRYAICEQHGVPYHLVEVSLPDLDAAQSWIIDHQDGRRNLTPNQLSYLRGKKYEIQKRQGKRTDLTSGKSYHKSHRTATALAQARRCRRKPFAMILPMPKRWTRWRRPWAKTRGAGPRPRRKLTQQDVKTLAKLGRSTRPMVQGGP